MQPDTIKHVKHVLIALILAAVVIGGLVIHGKYETRVADRMAARDEKISANQATVVQSQKENKTDTQAITTRDLQNALDVAALKSQSSQPLTAAQVDAIISNRLSGAVRGKDAQGHDTTTVETGYLADTLNKLYVNQTICDKNFSTCQADKENLNRIIGRLTTGAATAQDTIKLQGQQIEDMRKFQVPKNMLFFGVGKTEGTNFRDVNSYQPVIGYGRRLTSRFSIMGFAQNKSAAIGGVWNFGNLPK